MQAANAASHRKCLIFLRSGVKHDSEVKGKSEQETKARNYVMWNDDDFVVFFDIFPFLIQTEKPNLIAQQLLLYL